MPLFGPPNVEKLKAGGDVLGLIKALGYEGDRGDTRRAAIAALGQLGAAAVPALSEALQNSSLPVATAAAEALGRTHAQQAVKPLIQLLRQPNRFLQMAAVQGLKLLPTAESMAALQEALLGNEETARAAAEALAQMNLPVAWQSLAEMLGHSEFNARMAAAHGLVEVGTAGTPLLLDALENGNENARRSAAELLGQIRPMEALAVLLEMMADSSDYVALAAGDAVWRYGDAAIIPLLKVLIQGNDRLKTAAAQQLIRLGDRTERPLLAALQNADPDTRARVAVILGKIGSGWTVQPLIALARQTDPSLRYAAVQALAEIGGAGVVEAVITALEDENPYIRRAAREALIRIEETAETRALRNQIQGALQSHPPDRE